jgi:hypothetical protein
METILKVVFKGDMYLFDVRGLNYVRIAENCWNYVERNACSEITKASVAK